VERLSSFTAVLDVFEASLDERRQPLSRRAWTVSATTPWRCRCRAGPPTATAKAVAAAASVAAVEPLAAASGAQAVASVLAEPQQEGAMRVVDAALVLLAEDGDFLVTSDPDDIVPLAAAHGRHVEIVPP
jgi:hypothetical protein